MATRDLLVIVIAVEFGLHYFPWRQVLGVRLPRLAAYTLGMLGMMVPLSGWLMDRGELEVVQTLWCVIVAAGMTVFALYGFDHYISAIKDKRDAIQREQLVAQQLKETLDGTAK